MGENRQQSMVDIVLVAVLVIFVLQTAFNAINRNTIVRTVQAVCVPPEQP